MPTDRAFQLLDRMRSARRESESAVYWDPLGRASELSPRELETLRHLTAINRRLDDIAIARGTDPTRLRAEITSHLRRLLADRPVATRVGPEVLEAVLRDGRFKTKFETGKSAGGAKVEGRAWQEHTWFGYDRKILPDDRRPVYGYVMVNGEYAAATGPHGLGWFERLADSEWKQGIGDSDLLSAYGEVQVVFKPEVLQRTTFTVGDSWNYRESTFPSHILNPQPESFGALQKPLGSPPETGDLPVPTTVWDRPLLTMDREYHTPSFTASDYVEAQIHGGVSVSDIDHVLLPGEPTPELRRALDDTGTRWKVFNNETIARDGTRAERAAARERLTEQRRWLDNRLANHIRRTGAGPGDPVVDAAYERRAIFDREIEMLKRPRSRPADPVGEPQS
ncbi:hypothetical protein ACPESR_03570 [Nocardia testacea]|uniref:hypothetical protein n=1 Tax=Nocardia testacea TaxID=248551 RepID=UPI003C2FB5E9